MPTEDTPWRITIDPTATPGVDESAPSPTESENQLLERVQWGAEQASVADSSAPAQGPERVAAEGFAKAQGHGTNFKPPTRLEEPHREPSFDYIIVGGGTSGLALASRLAENSHISVCVIEAGARKIKDKLIDTPGLYGQSVGQKDYDWSYETVPQSQLNNRKVKSSAGRVLGGSSAINYMVGMRASSTEYDAWSQFGGAGWTWDGLLPYFKKSEQYVAPKKGSDQIFPGITDSQDEEARREEPKYCGYNGPVHRTYNTVYTDVLKPYIEAVNTLQIGTRRAPDYGNSTGVFNISTAVNRTTGTRSYAANTYLDNASKKGNLTVLTNVVVTKVSLAQRPHGKPGTAPLHSATGVECVLSRAYRSGKWGAKYLNLPFELYANKEVIISAGTYNTPKLLELSGIGKESLLTKHEISCVIDLPGVGENLQEHLFAPCDFVVNKGVFTIDKLRIDPKYRAEQELQYQTTHDGVYADTVSAYGYVKLDQISTNENEYNKIKAELDATIDAEQNAFYKMQYETQRKFLDDKEVGDVELIMVPHVFATSPPEENKSYVAMMAGTPRSYSRGSVHIASKNPLDSPVIDPQYLENAFDASVLVKGTMFVRKISETDPLKSKVTYPSTPPASVTTEAQFAEFVRNRSSSIQHPIGTAAMAPRKLGGVVGRNLMVHGTRNLRVVDMSIAPMHIASHLLETAYAIGEKAYDLIKADDVLGGKPTLR